MEPHRENKRKSTKSIAESKRARLNSDESRQLFSSEQQQQTIAVAAAASNNDSNIVFLFKNVPQHNKAAAATNNTEAAVESGIIEDYTIRFDSARRFTGIQWIDEYFKRVESVEKCCDFLQNFCLLATRPPEICAALSAFYYDYLQNVGRVVVNSMIDAALLIIFNFFYAYMTLNTAKCWTIVDLPPGVGKSYEMMRLFRLITAYYHVIMRDFEERSLISTPTARAQHVFPSGVARTLHSQMHLPIRANKCSAGDFYSFQQAIARSFASTEVRARIAIAQNFIFDEMSMYGSDMFEPVLRHLTTQTKFCLIIGDSCQLPPVQQKTIDWNWEAIVARCKSNPAVWGNVLVKCEDGPNIKIIRLSVLSSIRDQNLRSLILTLRKVIVKQMFEKTRTKRNLTIDLTRDGLTLWVDLFTNSLHVEHDLSFDDVLRSIQVSQTTINEQVNRLFKLEFMTRVCNTLATPTTTAAAMTTILSSNEFLGDNQNQQQQQQQQQQTLNQIFDEFSPKFKTLESFPVIMGYENNFNNEIMDYLLSTNSINTSNELNCWITTQNGQISNTLLKNVLVLSDEFDSSHVSIIHNQVTPNLLDVRNTFYPGMIIRCRENSRINKVYNGQVGYFVGFFMRVDKKMIFEDVRLAQFVPSSSSASDSVLSNSAASSSSSSFSYKQHQQKKFTSEIITGLRLPCGTIDVTQLARSMFMVFYDFETARFCRCHPTIKCLCETCDRERTIKDVKCFKHSASNFSRRPPSYLCFNWTCNYANTIFNVQGITLSSEHIYLLGKKVLKNNILRTLYVVLSRCKTSDQIHVDKQFVLIALKAIFNQSDVAVERALRSFAINF